MNDAQQPLGASERHDFAAEPQRGEHAGTADEQSFGALDIVQAFTALRQELKLQVRDGRELREVTAQGLGQLEQAVRGLSQSLSSALSAPTAEAVDGQTARRMAEAIAEIEESLQRAVTALEQTGGAAGEPLAAAVVAEIRTAQADLPRIARWFLGSWLQRLCDAVDQKVRAADSRQTTAAAAEGLALLLARVHRLMGQCELRRVDVGGLPFDPEIMNAIESVHTGSCPSGHVAEQLRPAYLWRESVLRTAEVRVQR